jgi:hypothetical protein
MRSAAPEDLTNVDSLERLLVDLGLNDEGMSELPDALHPHCGQGLRIWQYPIQFAPYLAHLAALGVRSYLEVGVRHGGSFVATVELLQRASALDVAVGVDIIPSPGLLDYARLNPRARFACLNTQSPAFDALLAELGSVDLVFIDSHHEEWQCRNEFAAVRQYANMIALHDVANVRCPGIGRVWSDVQGDDEFTCREFTRQYEGLGPFMGIGLAVKKRRLVDAPPQAGT